MRNCARALRRRRRGHRRARRAGDAPGELRLCHGRRRRRGLGHGERRERRGHGISPRAHLSAALRRGARPAGRDAGRPLAARHFRRSPRHGVRRRGKRHGGRAPGTPAARAARRVRRGVRSRVPHRAGRGLPEREARGDRNGARGDASFRNALSAGRGVLCLPRRARDASRCRRPLWRCGGDVPPGGAGTLAPPSPGGAEGYRYAAGVLYRYRGGELSNAAAAAARVGQYALWRRSRLRRDGLRPGGALVRKRPGMSHYPVVGRRAHRGGHGTAVDRNGKRRRKPLFGWRRVQSNVWLRLCPLGERYRREPRFGHGVYRTGCAGARAPARERRAVRGLIFCARAARAGERGRGFRVRLARRERPSRGKPALPV